MTKSGFSYLKLAAVVAVLAMALIGVNGLSSRTTVAREKTTTTPREIASTLKEKCSEPEATVLAAERGTTTPTHQAGASCNLGNGGVQITAIERTPGLVEKVEVGWNFTMPPQLAALGTCVAVDHFGVDVKVIYENGENKRKIQDASALSRNEVVRFGDIARKVKRIDVRILTFYRFTNFSAVGLSKDL